MQPLSALGEVTGGLTKNSKRRELPLQKKFLRVANVYFDELRLEDIATIGLTQAELEKTVLRKGDLLIVEGNGSLSQVGRVAVWDGSEKDCVHQNHLIRWRPQETESKWALYALISPQGRKQLEQKAHSTSGLHTLSVRKVSELTIPTPLIEEQKELIRVIDLLLDNASEQEKIIQDVIAKCEKLQQSLLAKAFRGELVAQDPNDEPASVLLERIKAQREAEAAAKKPAKRGRKKKADTAQLVIPAGIADNHLAKVLEECGSLSERALLAASELEPGVFQLQLNKELKSGALKQVDVDGEAFYAEAAWEE